MSKIFIMAAGDQSRWGGSTPKQLAAVFGEPVIVRTVRLLKSVNLSPNIVTHRSDLVDACKSPQIYPKDRQTILHSLYSTRFSWDDVTTVLLGDVYYTRRALNIILKDENECMFFGNAGEIFALRFKGNFIQSHLIALCDSTLTELKLWTLYRKIENLAIDRHMIVLRPGGRFRYIDDGTDDVDAYSDVSLIEQRLRDTLRDVEYINEKVATARS